MVSAVSLLELGREQRRLYQPWLEIDPRDGLLHVVYIRGQEEGLRKNLRIEERRDNLPHGMEIGRHVNEGGNPKPTRVEVAPWAEGPWRPLARKC